MRPKFHRSGVQSFTAGSSNVSRDKVEVDIVLENRRKEVIAIEVKASATVGAEDFRGIQQLANRLGDDLIAGSVLYLGERDYTFGDKFRALPVSALWEVEP